MGSMAKELTQKRYIQRDNLDVLLSKQGVVSALSAPAGFGKTTAIHLWLEKTEKPFCWITLGKHHNDRHFFWRAFIEQMALALNNPAMLDYFDFSHPNAVVFFPQILAQYLDANRKQMQKFVVVFDDIHHIEQADAVSALGICINTIFTHCKTVVAGRGSDNFEIISGDCHGLIDKIDANALAFSHDETYQYLRQHTDNDISINKAAKIQDATAGWPLVLPLVTFRENKHSDFFREDFQIDVTSLSESINLVFEEIFLDLPKATQTFLSVASALPRFCPALMEAILEKPIDATFFEIRNKHLFVREDQQRAGWYYLHDLFKDYLSFRFDRLLKEEQNKCFKLAANWYFEKGDYGMAFAFSRHAELWSLVISSLSKLFDEYFSDGTHHHLYHEIIKVPEEIINRSPTLLLILAWVLPDSEKASRSFQLVESAIPLLEQLDQSAAETRRLRCRSATLLAFLYFWKGDIISAIKQNRIALKYSNKTSRYLKTRILNTLGQCYFHLGWMTKAETVMRQSLAVGIEKNRAYDIAVSLVYLLEALRLQGKGQEALEIYESTRQLCMKEDSEFNPKYLWIRNAIIPIYLELGLFENARYLLDKTEKALRVIPTNVTFLSYYLMRVVESLIQCRWENTKLALDQWESAQRKVQAHIGVGKSSPSGYRALLHLRSDNLAAAEVWAEKSISLSQSQDFRHEDDKLILVRILLQKNDPSALNLLYEIRQTAQSQNRNLTVMISFVIEAGYYFQHNKSEQAEQIFRLGLEHAISGYFLLSLLAEGSFTIALLNQLKKKGEKHSTPPSINKLLALGNKVYSKHINTVSSLTQKEGAVLNLLAKGLRDQDVADELSISLGTVKTHARNIYRKLGVKNRSQAVYKAEKLGLR